MFLFRFAKVIAWFILVVATEVFVVTQFPMESSESFWFFTLMNLTVWSLIASKCKVDTNI